MQDILGDQIFEPVRQIDAEMPENVARLMENNCESLNDSQLAMYSRSITNRRKIVRSHDKEEKRTLSLPQKEQLQAVRRQVNML